MSRPSSKQPTEGELEILTLLWEHGPQELGSLCARIREHRSVATTTVATMLKVMMEKKIVKRTRGQRGYIWRAVLTKRVAAESLVGNLLNSAFGGSAFGLVSHLLEEGHLSEKDRRVIAEMLDRADAGEKGGRR